MNTDYMIGDSYGENLISEITLALLEDSGWYKVDYEMANMFHWGQNKGCAFFEEKCISKSPDKLNYLTKFKNEFCVDFNKPICSIDHVFRANCKTEKHDSLPEYDRYFDDPKLGGSDPLTDYCPIPIEEKNDNTYYGGSCRVGTQNGAENFEKICPECACFMSSLKENSIRKYRFLQNKFILNNNSENLRASCHEFKCEGDSLTVQIGDKSFPCNSQGETKIPGYNGYIICPDKDLLCDRKFKCKFGCTEKYDNSKAFFTFK